MTGANRSAGRSGNDALWAGSDKSARAIVPFTVQLVEPRSVIDVGCGNGAWLSVFLDHGIEDVLGVDAPSVDQAVLRIPRNKFRAVDLRQPFSAGRRFDLALCVEVAEHLPPDRGPTLVEELVALAPVVLFSAAVPGQGGQGHFNEQWPDYWAGLFQRNGFRLVDVVRRPFWDAPEVEPWYSQNSFFFVAEDHVPNVQRLAEEASSEPPMPLRVIHPRLFTYEIEMHERTPSTRSALRTLAKAVASGARRRLRRRDS